MKFIKKHLKKIIVCVSFVTVLFVSIPCSAISEVVSFKDSLYNVVQVDWSNSNDVQTSVQVTENVNVSHNKGLTNIVGYGFNKPASAVKTSSFSLHTKWGKYDKIFFSIPAEYGNTYFKFRIDLGAYYQSNIDGVDTDVSSYFDDLRFYTDYLKGQLYYNQNGDYINALRVYVLPYYTGNLELGCNYSIEYWFKVPEGGITVNGFNFTFQHNIKNNVNISSLSNVVLLPYFQISDFSLDTENINLYFNFEYLEDFKDKENLLNDKALEYEAFSGVDFAKFYPILTRHDEFLSTLAGANNIFNNFVSRFDWLYLVLELSLILGCFSFLIGLVSNISSVVNFGSFSFERRKYTQARNHSQARNYTQAHIGSSSQKQISSQSGKKR